MSTTTSAATPSLKLVSLEQIHIPEGGNPRKRFDERALQELADSIGKHGVLQPLVVRTSENGYTLIAGERRYRAAKLAGLKQLPVTLRDGDDDSPLELAVDENLHRQDLDPVEEAVTVQLP
jgi:ParB family chromosome partitioning protein